MVFLVSGGLSEGARPFPLKILDTKISVNSTSGECIIYILTSRKFGKMVDLSTNHSPACVLLVDKFAERGNLTNGGHGKDMARLM